MVVFECTRCGTCCMKHVGKMAGHVHGLMILPEERKLFQEDIEPMFRYSLNFRPDPGRVFMYQIGGNPCPHYAREEKACLIYSKRPVVCQTYPFEMRGGGGIAMHEFCPEIARLTKIYEPNDIHCPTSYYAIGQKLRNHYNVWMVTGEIERYDLKEEKWYHVLHGVTSEHLA